MEQLFSVDIDHVGMISTDLALCRQIFCDLGFSCGPGSAMLTGIAGEKAADNLHFMLDNTYLECIESKPGDYLGEYLRSDAALHTVVLGSGDYKASHKRAAKAGFSLSGPMVASRPADHGVNKGTASFGWFKVLDCATPNTLLGVAQHLNRELIFQEGRYRHPNTAYMADQLIACGTREEIRAWGAYWETLCKALGSTGYRTGIRSLRIMEPRDIADGFGAAVNPARSHYVGLRFVLESTEPLLRRLAGSKYKHHPCREGIVVDLTRQLNLFLVFAAPQGNN